MTPIKSDKPHLKKQVNIDTYSLNAIMIILAVIIALLLITGIYFIVAATSESGPLDLDNFDTPAGSNASYPFKQEIEITVPAITDDTEVIPTKSETSAGIYSEFAALIDVTENTVIASKKAARELYPASMTKVMTLIVVIENLKTEDAMQEELTISAETVDRMYAEGSSGYGFKAGEKLTVEALLHALILQSDGIAANTLAEYIAGSEAAFVDLMNAKAQELGMTNTTFQNCTGLDHDYLLTTCQDVGTMMIYAMKNTFCANILTAKSYKLPDSFRPDNTYTLYHATLASKFDTLGVKNQLQTVEVTAAKSGWIGSASGHCLVTYAEGDNGHKYVLVTAKATTSEEAIADLIYIYNNYAK
ncbi:MAG: D-alanyl-D-alanine carboxypeptidase [Clostridia bacterium]|nr:D-alanyl-D-alanine carboxypeptidase [Clostridia bacterium]